MTHSYKVVEHIHTRLTCLRQHFVKEKTFFDTKKFPRGFAKSGDFTLAEEDILTRYGDTMLGLESGELQPENADEEHFLKVLANPELAENKLESLVEIHPSGSWPQAFPYLEWPQQA